MVEASWGEHDESSAFGLGLDRTQVDSDNADDVPAVAAARAHGFAPANEAPLWCFIPALWPADSRAWVRDMRVRHMVRQCDDNPPERLPWSVAEHADLEIETNALLAELGLPSRPAGRIWLLRAPHPYPSPQAVLDEIWEGWRQSGAPAMATPAFVEYVDRRLREIF